MKKIITGIIICLLLANCNKKEANKDKNTTYIISENNKKRIIRGNDTVPPPPPIPGWLIYGTNTFIIDNDSTIYYFQRPPIGFICGTETADTIPYFINLKPSDLIEIPHKNIYYFIKANYKNHNNRHITFIVSKSDTLKSKAYFDLKRVIESSIYDRDSYHIRRTTQEEDTVLYYKKNEKYYFSDEIKWDTLRIKLPHKTN